ncbi:hypothetical protein ASG56_16515 [Rhodococcus sp. Leaf7]|uniref:DUF5677 domain-containing protein n=1 Tax=unclassified Rhodococcus (in: high G+C Gram-positive bacteria) TaxID=192944 RepID=UPI0006FD8884|nr:MULTISPECIES: DUF5677 domain-containing protein [unclassified Rhodococcus (in: high G+C Gram-positive bacteria)]KQU02554.1 hypothetical protein ASG56_16515 [Rhodococcus sp. Leaf7]KQU38025.1 hypothetical protein ASG64_19245 [Rhodococcus sp. Leaf247]
MSNSPDLTALEVWIEECIAHLRDTDEFEVNRVHEEEFLLLYGLVARVMGYSDAYLRLSSAGLVAEAVVLARAAIEHAVTLQWVFTVDGGVSRFQSAIANDRINHFKNLAAWLDTDELAQQVVALKPPPPGKQLPKFMNMLRDVDQNEFLEMSYHILSQHVHVTHAAVTAFLERGTEGLHIRHTQQYGYHYQSTYIVAVACMLARWVVAKLTSNAGLLKRLDEVSNRLVIPMTLIDGLEPEKKRPGL